MTRMHERRLEVAAERDGERWILTSPGPGWFVPGADPGDLVIAGRPIGELEVLGRRVRLLAPSVHGINQPGHDTPRAVGHGDVLLVLDTAATAPGLGASPTAPSAAEAAATGLVFRAPTSGRFYGRPAPDKPPFVSAGDEISPGATVCLLEVMKTFHRVTYGGPGLPERARVREVLVADGADVTSGDPLLALE